MVQEGFPQIHVVSEGQLQQGSRLLQLLHQPQAWMDTKRRRQAEGRTPHPHPRGLTCADQRAAVVQRPQVRPRQRQEGVQLGQVAAEARPGQHRADDDVPQRMADEAAGRKEEKAARLLPFNPPQRRRRLNDANIKYTPCKCKCVLPAERSI